jgi:hypothetical protein
LCYNRTDVVWPGYGKLDLVKIDGREKPLRRKQDKGFSVIFEVKPWRF